jgi:PAS domain S-box-containing protein
MKERQTAKRPKPSRPARAAFGVPTRSAADAEAPLRTSEERLQLATEALAGFLYDTDLCTGQVRFFSGVQEIFGFDPDECPLDFAWWQSRVHPDDLPRVMTDWQAVLEGDDRTYAFEYRFRHEDGHYLDLLDRGRIVRDTTGRAIRSVGGSADVSKRRLLERDREKLLAALQWERSRLREIFDAAPSFFCLTRGPDHIIEYVNEAYYKLARRRDLIGRRLFDVFPEGKDQPYPAIRDRVLRDGITFEGKEMPLIAQEADGSRSERFIDVTLLPFTEPDGTRSGIILHGIDVTSHVLARREIEWLLADSEGLSSQERESRLTAEKAIRARDEMLRIVSHELGGPMSVINIAVAGILASAGSSPAIQDSAAILKRATEWMQRLLEDLGDAASIEAGRLALAPVHETPRALVTQVAEMFAGGAHRAGIKLEASIAPDLPVLVVDSARMLQALGNLVTNALKATKPGGRITILAARDPTGVRLAVEDSGIGITPENLPYMFDRVWQEHHHTNEGLGLGLAIVRGIVEAHGGALQVTSTPGEGSRFSFTVPIANPTPGIESKEMAAQAI